jgi:probable rRNA maturation factor
MAEALVRAVVADMAAPAVDVVIDAGGWGAEDGPLVAAGLRAAQAAAASQPAGAPVELTVVLSDDAAVQALNARWRGRDAPTNVLAFPGCAPAEIAAGGLGASVGAPEIPLLLGDVVVAFETCMGEAEAAGIPPPDHLAHLVVHGVLHLFGHDHGTDDEAERMEALEAAVLAGMGIADPYARPWPEESRR